MSNHSLKKELSEYLVEVVFKALKSEGFNQALESIVVEIMEFVSGKKGAGEEAKDLVIGGISKYWHTLGEELQNDITKLIEEHKEK